MLEKEIEVAIEWWGNLLENPKENGYTTSWNTRYHNRLPHFNQEEIKLFKEGLKEALNLYLKGKIKHHKDFMIRPAKIIIECDYDADVFLSMACKKAVIDSEWMPQKTLMRIDENMVDVSAGYGSQFELLYGETLESQYLKSTNNWRVKL